jgi:hypothetical protein
LAVEQAHFDDRQLGSWLLRLAARLQIGRDEPQNAGVKGEGDGERGSQPV